MERPFLKWAGNKYRVLDRILSAIPDRGIPCYLIEPFAGSCALSINTEYPHCLIADINPDLINLYEQLRNEGQSFIDYCQTYFTQSANSAEAYYSHRKTFNETKDVRQKSALFLYLNKHGFNGLCRYNQSGGFNVPFGRYTKPYFPSEEMVYFHQRTQRFTFRHSGFVETLARAQPGDIVYCDPPYVPLSETANFTAYHKSGFGEQDQQQLAHLAKALAGTGVTVVISNHDTEVTRQLYSEAEIISFDVQRTMSANVTKRGKVPELLAIFKD